jgi:hypothetical protein
VDVLELEVVVEPCTGQMQFVSALVLVVLEVVVVVDVVVTSLQFPEPSRVHFLSVALQVYLHLPEHWGSRIWGVVVVGFVICSVFTGGASQSHLPALSFEIRM